jgi:hypothetical protein
MPTSPTEITTALGTLSVSSLIYLIASAFVTLLASILGYLFTDFIQQRAKKNNTLRLIGTVYGPLRYFLEVRYISVVSLVVFLTFMFLSILLILLSFFFRSDSDYYLNIIFFISLMLWILSIYILIKLIDKKNQTIKESIDEISAYIIVDIDSLTLRWKALYWGALVLAEKYFFLWIFVPVIFTTSVLSLLNKGFTVLGIELILFYISSFFLSLELVSFLRFICLGPNDKRLKVSFFDTNDEIESRLFNLIKEPSLCLCIVDDRGNKHCGSLEGITYSVLIRDKGGILVGIPYDHVYRVEECKAKDDNTGSTLQPYL